MVRYLLSLLVFFAGFVLTFFMVGGSILIYLDITTFCIVGLLPFLFASLLFGLREMPAAFATALRKEPEADSIAKAQGFFNVFGSAIWIMGMINVIFRIIGMLASLESRDEIWAYLALALLSILYSGILYLTAVLPFTLLLKKKQKAQPAEDDGRVA
jgi:flagellar motor component MotA